MSGKRYTRTQSSDFVRSELRYSGHVLTVVCGISPTHDIFCSVACGILARQIRLTKNKYFVYFSRKQIHDTSNRIIKPTKFIVCHIGNNHRLIVVCGENEWNATIYTLIARKCAIRIQTKNTAR